MTKERKAQIGSKLTQQERKALALKILNTPEIVVNTVIPSAPEVVQTVEPYVPKESVLPVVVVPKEPVIGKRVPGRNGGTLVNGAFQRPSGQQPFQATAVRARILDKMLSLVDVQIQIASDLSDYAAATRAWRGLAEYSLGKPKRVELGDEAFAKVVLTAVATALADHPQHLQAVKDAIAAELRSHTAVDTTAYVQAPSDQPEHPPTPGGGEASEG